MAERSFGASRRNFLEGMALTLAAGALSACATRQYFGRNVDAEGLVGTLFLPVAPPPYPAVITLTGAEGGIEAEPAQGLAAAGFATLALATHNAHGLPRTVRNVPLEYCERAINWLRETVRPRNDFVAVRGWSRGAELALILGAMFPSIKTVLAYAPRGSIGLASPNFDNFSDPATPPAWTWQGKPLVFEPLPRAMFEDPDRPAPEEGRFGIPVERTAGPILFVTGTEDEGVRMDPVVSCRRMMRRLDLFHFPYRHEHWIYADAGHDIDRPPPFQGHVERDGALDGGGTVEGDTRAVADSWPRSIAFLREAAG